VNPRAFYRWMCWFFIPVIGLFLTGCAKDLTQVKDPFFEKWGTMAENSQGHSPTARGRIMEMPPLEEDEMITDEASKKEKPLPTRRVSLRMHNVDINVILRALAQAANVNIMLRSGIKGETSISIENKPWDQAFLGILKTNGLSYTWEGDIIRIMTGDDMERDLKLDAARERMRGQKLLTMVVSVDYADANKLKDSMKELFTKDKDGKVRGSILVDQHTNSMIIQATRDDLKRMIPMIERLDKPAAQILIKANIVEATKETARNLGVQWGGVYTNRWAGQDYFVTPGGSGGTSGVSPLSGSYTPTYGSTGIGGQGNAFNFPVSPTAIAAAGGAGSLGLIFGTIGGSFLEVQLQALQQDGQLNILSSPSITTLDNQMAYTENGERVPYVATSTSSGVVTQEVKFEDAVLRLEITPHVIDGKHLKMKIKVKKDQVDPTRTVQGNPYIIKKQTETNLIVQDSETIVISGLTKQQISTSNSGIPGLKDIPGIGYLFKGDSKSDSMEEVLIFITPHVLKAQAANQAAPAAATFPAKPAPAAPSEAPVPRTEEPPGK
jgi:type IV pilus assembly protein PilQ